MTNWKEIHEDFAKKPPWSSRIYQQIWEIYGITYQEAQEWIQAGFEPGNYDVVNQWKDKNFDPSTAKEWIFAGFKLNEAEKAKQWKEREFTPQQAKSWIEVGLKPHEVNFANYLKQNNYQPIQLSNNFQQTRKEFYLNYSPNQAYLCCSLANSCVSYQINRQVCQQFREKTNILRRVLFNEEAQNLNLTGSLLIDSQKNYHLSNDLEKNSFQLRMAQNEVINLRVEKNHNQETEIQQREQPAEVSKWDHLKPVWKRKKISII